MIFFFFNDTATTEIYTLSLHDALPIYDVADHADRVASRLCGEPNAAGQRVMDYQHRSGDLRCAGGFSDNPVLSDRKSTRLNSSHSQISYAVFCLKKKKRLLQVRIYISH